MLSDIELYSKYCLVLTYLVRSSNSASKTFFSFYLKARLVISFIQNWNSGVEHTSRVFYKHLSSFQYQYYLNALNTISFPVSCYKLFHQFYILLVETGRWKTLT